jgi:hypothetical protein
VDDLRQNRQPRLRLAPLLKHDDPDRIARTTTARGDDQLLHRPSVRLLEP